MQPQQSKPDLSKFFSDPDWHFVEEMLSNNLEDTRDISTLDLSQTAETLKAIVAGRQESIKLVENFKHQVRQYKTIINNDTPSFK